MNRVQFEVDCKRLDSRYYGMEMEEVYLPIKGRARTHHRRLHNNNNNNTINNNNNRVIRLSSSDFVSVDLIGQKVNVDVQQRTTGDVIDSPTHDVNVHRHLGCDANLQQRSTCDASESRQSIFEGVVPPPNQCVTPYANLASLPMEQV